MPLFPAHSRHSHVLRLSAALCLLSFGTPVLAQKTIDGRVDRLEKEMRAVQRKVFPGGDGRIVAPDETPAAAPPQLTGTPATPPLADLTARVNAIESQLAQVTGQVEQNGHRLKLLEDAFSKLAAQQKADAAAIQAASGPPAAGASAGQPAGGPAKPAAGSPGAPKVLGAQPQPKADSAAIQARTKAVAAIERPHSGNAASDSYVYGYRLWAAKFYPEAEAQLQDTLDKFAKDSVASRAGNLLGRTYLDDGKPTEAAKILYENYRLRPKGDRAAESLAWTAEALIQLDRLKLACQAYGELKDAFGADIPASVKDMVAKGRTRAKCGG